MEAKFDVIEQFLYESIWKLEGDGFQRDMITIHIPFYIQGYFVSYLIRETNIQPQPKIQPQLEMRTFQGVKIEDNYLNTIAVSVKYALSKPGYQPLILNL